jgi:hypothetical protein
MSCFNGKYGGWICRFAWVFFSGMRRWADLRDVPDDDGTVFHPIG